jgi:hypothetical protein
MKTIEVKIYSFSELSETAKQTAIQDYLSKDRKYFWAEENTKSIEAFFDLFPIKNKSYNWNDIRWEFIESENISNLSGIRLLKYLLNNYGKDLYKPKYIKSLDGERIKHNRLKRNQAKNTGNVWNTYYSAIQKETSCVFTGYCADDDILQPIYNFIQKPDNTSFDNLLGECIAAFESYLQREDDYFNSSEFAESEIEANEYDFLENGERF